MRKILREINFLSIIKVVLILVIFGFFVNNVFAYDALERTKSGSALTNPLGNKTFTQIIQGIIGYLILIGAPILAIMVIYGGFLILSAGDSPEKVKSGKDVILWAVVGYIVILSSWGVIYIIREITGAKIPGI